MASFEIEFPKDEFEESEIKNLLVEQAVQKQAVELGLINDGDSLPKGVKISDPWLNQRTILFDVTFPEK